MIRYKSIDVSGVANQRSLGTLLVGISGVRRHVDAVQYVETTGTLQHDATLELWLEQEQLLSMPVQALLDGASSPVRLPDQWIPVDLDLPEGKTLSAGHISGSTASDYSIVVRYTEE